MGTILPKTVETRVQEHNPCSHVVPAVFLLPSPTMEGSQDPSVACAGGSLDLVYKLWLAEIKHVSGIKWLKSQA